MNTEPITERSRQRWEARRLVQRIQGDLELPAQDVWRVLGWLVAHKPEAAVLDRMAPSVVDHETREACR